MRRQTVLHPQSQRAGSRIGTRSKDRVNLAVPVFIGRIQLALQDTAVQQHVRFEAGQGSNHVVRAKMAVPNDLDDCESSFRDQQSNSGVGQTLRWNADADSGITAIPIGVLQAGCGFTDLLQCDGRARGWRENPLYFLRAEEGVAGNLEAADFKCGQARMV